MYNEGHFCTKAIPKTLAGYCTMNCSIIIDNNCGSISIEVAQMLDVLLLSLLYLEREKVKH